MLTVAVSISDQMDRIFQPVTEQIMRTYLRRIGAHNVFKHNLYPVAEHLAPARTDNPDGTPKLKSEDKLTFTINPNINLADREWDGHFRQNGQLPLTHTFLAHQKSVHEDPGTSAKLKPLLRPVVLEVECEAMIRNRSTAYEMLTAIRNDILTVPTWQLFDIVYDYPIPPTIIDLMKTMAIMQGYNSDTFEHYLERFSDGKISKIVNKLQTDRGSIVIRENYKHVNVILSCSMAKPEARMENQVVTNYVVAFTMQIHILRPECLIYSYPIVVNNKFIPGDCVKVSPSDIYPTPIPESPFLSIDRCKALLNRESPDLRIETIRCPWYDLWNLPHDSPILQFGYFPFLIAVFTLDNPENTQEVTNIDLANMGEIQIIPEVLESITTADYNPLKFDGEYHIGVYKDGHLVEPSSMVSLDGSVLSVKDRDKGDIYRLVLSVRRELMCNTFHFRVLVVDIHATDSIPFLPGD